MNAVTHRHTHRPGTKDEPVPGRPRTGHGTGAPDLERLSPGDVVALQRLAGNQAVGRLVAQRRQQPPEQSTVEDVTRDDVDQVLRGGGKPLADPFRRRAESALGMDLSQVRLHTGADAAASAASLRARAYTVGRDVVVGSGGGDDETMLHELKHVEQQARGAVPGRSTTGGLHLSDPGDAAEREASAFAAQAVRAPVPAVQRAAGRPVPGPGVTAVQRMMETDLGEALALRDHHGEELHARDDAALAEYVRDLAHRGRDDIYRLLVSRLNRLDLSDTVTALDEVWNSEDAQAPADRRAVVPRQLHFVWLGTEPAADAIANLLAWKANIAGTTWTMHLWTDSAATWVTELQNQFDGHLQVHPADSALAGTEVGDQNRELYAQSITRGAFNLASDILRYGILLKEGGVYMDVDIAPGRVQLSTAQEVRLHLESVPLLAPQLRDQKSVNTALGQTPGTPLNEAGLEEAAGIRYEAGKFNNNLIAVPPGSAFIQDLLDNLPRNIDRLKTDLGLDAYPLLKELAPDISGPNFIEKRLGEFAAAHLGVTTWVAREGAPPIHEIRQEELQILMDPGLREFWKVLEWVTTASEDQLDQVAGPSEEKKKGKFREIGRKIKAIIKR